MLQLVLRLGSAGFFIVSLSHLVLGLGADVLLGARLAPEVVRDPVLDSQNRFYGTVFALYGVLLAIGAADVARHAVTLQCCFWCFFAGGVARLVSMAISGMPPMPILALAASELVLPPLLSLWLSRSVRAS